MALHITITLSTDIYTVTQIPDLSAEHNNTAMSSKDTETKVAEVAAAPAAAPAPAPTSPKASTTKDASAASPSRRKVKLVKRTDFKVKKPVVDTLAEEKAFREAIALAFKKWDHNNDDTIDPSEVKQVLEESKLDASKEMVDAIIGPMDSNKNGRIEFEEFVASYQRKHSHNRQKDDPVTEMEQMFRRKRLDSDPGKAPQDSADDQKDDGGDSDDKAKTDK